MQPFMRHRLFDDDVEADFCVLRTPALPFDDFLAWVDAPTDAGKHCGVTAAGAHESECLKSRDTLRARLLTIVQRPEVLEALCIASPDLVRSIDRWRTNPHTVDAQRTERSIVRYFARMTGRATQFGLFAGCTVGTLEARTDLRLVDREQYRRATRVDVDVLVACRHALLQDAGVRSRVRYRPNSTLHRVGQSVRYVEEFRENDVRQYRLATVDASPYLATILEAASAGALPDSLVTAVKREHGDLDVEEIAQFVDEVIESGLLTGLPVLVTSGERAERALADTLRDVGCASAAVERLEAIAQSLDAIDLRAYGAMEADYARLDTALGELSAGIQRGFYVDLVKPADHVSLGQQPVRDLLRSVDVLYRLFGDDYADPLVDLRAAFEARYEQQEVPLLDALDEDTGIGFERTSGAVPKWLPSLDDPASVDVNWRPRDAWLLERLVSAARTGSAELVIAGDEFPNAHATPKLALPHAFSVKASLLAPSESALNAGQYRVLIEGMSGPSGARILGRVCHADPALDHAVREHLAAEESLRPDAVFAEIVHLPQGRGKIVQRPVLRRYEIPYQADSGVDIAHQIPVSDLLLSVRDNRFVLRSRRLDCEVIPRLTSAHSYTEAGLGVYRFLCHLQTQGMVPALLWQWGPFDKLPFLPRVTRDNLVFAPAQWRVHRHELESLCNDDGTVRPEALRRWRSERSLPRLIEFVEEEQALPVDLDNVLSVEAFVSIARRREDVKLVEMLRGVGDRCVRGPEGGFVHEVIVPFIRRPRQMVSNAHAARRSEMSRLGERESETSSTTTLKRRFAPGSEWLYVKLYGGPFQLDAHVRETLGRVAAVSTATNAVDRWFFLRYADPDWHLRFRLHGPPARLLTEVLPSIHDAVHSAIENGTMTRMQVDTYAREVERYGGPTLIDLAESVFHVDSEAVVALLSDLSAAGLGGEAGLEDRLWLALHTVDTMCEDFGLALEERAALCAGLDASFAHEFHVTNTRRLFSQSVRRFKPLLERVVQDGSSPRDLGDVARAALRRRSEVVRVLGDELRRAESLGVLSGSRQGVIASFIHMHINRLLSASARAQEFALHHLLLRTYESQLARRRSAQPSHA